MVTIPMATMPMAAMHTSTMLTVANITHSGKYYSPWQMLLTVVISVAVITYSSKAHGHNAHSRKCYLQ